MDSALLDQRSQGLCIPRNYSERSTVACVQCTPSKEISPADALSWRHRRAAQEQRYKRLSYEGDDGDVWNSAHLRRTKRADRDWGLLVCCRLDGREEWHHEQPVIQCDFRMGYCAAQTVPIAGGNRVSA